MNLYLVRGYVEISRYMQDGVERQEDIRLVQAVSEDSAEYKWKTFWEDKTSAYSVGYYACATDVSGVIK